MLSVSCGSSGRRRRVQSRARFSPQPATLLALTYLVREEGQVCPRCNLSPNLLARRPLTPRSLPLLVLSAFPFTTLRNLRPVIPQSNPIPLRAAMRLKMRSASQEFSNYHHLHTSSANKLLHFIGVPPIQLSFLIILSFYTHPIAILLSAVIYLIHHTTLSPRAALLCLPYIASVHGLSFLCVRRLTAHPSPHTALAALAACNALCWAGQFYGHYFLEGNSPAVTESIIGPLLSAPLFVVLEVLWAMGLAQDLRSIGEKH